jgi:hypothetical protein
LIGNKADRPTHITKETVVNEWVRSQKACTYIETSAVQYEGVEEAFLSIGKFANDYQKSLKEKDSSVLRHSVINVN